MKLLLFALALASTATFGATDALYSSQSANADVTGSTMRSSDWKNYSYHLTPTSGTAGDLTLQASNDGTNFVTLSQTVFVNGSGGNFVSGSDWPYAYARVLWDSYYFDNTHSVNFDGTSAEWAQNATPTQILDASSKFVDRSYTVSIWVYQNSTTNAFVSKGTNTALEWQLYSDGVDRITWLSKYGGGGEVYAISTETVGTGAWSHVVATYNGNGSYTGVKLYLNGQQTEYANAAANSTRDYIKTGGALYLGTHNNSGSADYCDCYLSNLAIWTTELTASQIDEIYNNGKPFDVSQYAAVSDYLAGYWKLGTGDTHPTYTDVTGNNDLTAESGVEAGDITTTQVPSDASGTFDLYLHTVNN